MWKELEAIGLQGPEYRINAFMLQAIIRNDTLHETKPMFEKENHGLTIEKTLFEEKNHCLNIKNHCFVLLIKQFTVKNYPLLLQEM